jgi:hypothetical protein
MAVALMLPQDKRAFRSSREALSGARPRDQTFLLFIGDSGSSQGEDGEMEQPLPGSKGRHRHGLVQHCHDIGNRVVCTSSLRQRD